MLISSEITFEQMKNVIITSTRIVQVFGNTTTCQFERASMKLSVALNVFHLYYRQKILNHFNSFMN